MKKGLIVTLAVLGGILLIVLMLVGWIVGTYNGFVGLETTVDQTWADVESSYQRRLDLIPNLVSTVQGAADFESDTLTEVTQLRSQAVAAQTGFAQASDLQGQQAAIQQGESALGRFLLIMENYPQLTATQNFADLQVQLEGTENRINVARNRYNEAVRNYNTATRQLPGAFVANLFGFDQKDSFQADAGAENAPEVQFN